MRRLRVKPVLMSPISPTLKESNTMQTRTYSQRPDDDGKINDLKMETAVDGDQVIITVGPIGGPFQSVYLSPLQAEYMGKTLDHMAGCQIDGTAR